MTTTLRIAVFSLAMCVSLQSIFSQQWTPPVRRLGFLHVVRQVPNQRALELSDLQAQEIEKIRNEAKNGYRVAMENAQNFAGQERSDVLRMAYQDSHKIADERVKSVLTARQLERAKQLVLRARLEAEGILSVVHSSDVDRQLNLLAMSNEQQTELHEKVRESDEQLQKKLHQLYLEYQLAVKKLKNDSQAEVLSVFSKGQRQIISKALGANPTDTKTPLERFEK